MVSISRLVALISWDELQNFEILGNLIENLHPDDGCALVSLSILI